MVSVNSALEVDLHGQIIADTMGARQYTGVGGRMDFVGERAFRSSTPR